MSSNYSFILRREEQFSAKSDQSDRGTVLPKRIKPFLGLLVQGYARF